MKTYSVKDIAELLKTNPETVRRWIRNGKLKAAQESRKGGNTVTEEELNQFLKNTPKYAAIAISGLIAGLPLPLLGLPLAAGGLLSKAFIEHVEAENAKVNPQSIITQLENNIAALEKNIQKKRTTITQLESEIKDETTQIEALNKSIALIRRNLEEK